MTEWQLGNQQDARHWYSKARAYGDQLRAHLMLLDAYEDFDRLITEAARLLDITEDPSPTKDDPEKPKPNPYASRGCKPPEKLTPPTGVIRGKKPGRRGDPANERPRRPNHPQPLSVCPAGPMACCSLPQTEAFCMMRSVIMRAADLLQSVRSGLLRPSKNPPAARGGS